MTPLSPEAERISRELAGMLGQTPFGIAGNVVRVPSRTTPGAFYEVLIGLDGALTCECPASFYPARGECWHVRFVREDMTMTNESTALVPVVVRPPVELLPSSHDLDVVQRAAAMAYAGAVSLPPELNTPEKVAAVMLYGLELGLRPMTAIQGLYIVKGKVSASAQIMMGLCMSREPNIEFHVKRTDESVCTIRMVRPLRHIDAELTVTWEQIKRAGLAGGVNAVYPEDRLRYHCIKRLCRTYAPDLINGLDEGVSVTGVTEPAPWPVADADLYNEGDAPANVDRETGEIIEHEAPAAPEGGGRDPVAPPASPHGATQQAPVSASAGTSDDPEVGTPAAPSPDEAAADRKEITRLVKELQGVWPADEVQALGRELKQYLPDPTAKFTVGVLDADAAAAALGHIRSAMKQRQARMAQEEREAALEALDEAEEAPAASEPPHEAVMKYTPGGRAFCEVCGGAVDEQTGLHAETVAWAAQESLPVG